MKLVCPNCGSEKIVPLFARDDIWVCLDCGFSGKPQYISPHLEEFWTIYRQAQEKSLKVKI